MPVEFVFEQVLAAVEQARWESRGRWLRKHGDWAKWLVLWVARRYCGLTLRQLGQRMGGMDYAAVCVGLGRFEKRLNTDPALHRAPTQAVEMLNV